MVFSFFHCVEVVFEILHFVLLGIEDSFHFSMSMVVEGGDLGAKVFEHIMNQECRVAHNWELDGLQPFWGHCVDDFSLRASSTPRIFPSLQV